MPLHHRVGGRSDSAAAEDTLRHLGPSSGLSCFSDWFKCSLGHSPISSAHKHSLTVSSHPALLFSRKPARALGKAVVLAASFKWRAPVLFLNTQEHCLTSSLAFLQGIVLCVPSIFWSRIYYLLQQFLPFDTWLKQSLCKTVQDFQSLFLEDCIATSRVETTFQTIINKSEATGSSFFFQFDGPRCSKTKKQQLKTSFLFGE